MLSRLRKIEQISGILVDLSSWHESIDLFSYVTVFSHFPPESMLVDNAQGTKLVLGRAALTGGGEGGRQSGLAANVPQGQ